MDEINTCAQAIGRFYHLSKTDHQALDNMESIWLKFSFIDPSLKDTVDIAEVHAACHVVSSHHLRRAHQTIALIETGDIPLITEFFDELNKLPDLQAKQATISEIKTIWLDHFRPHEELDLKQATEYYLIHYQSILEEFYR